MATVKLGSHITLNCNKPANKKVGIWSFNVPPMNIGVYSGSYETPEDALKGAMDRVAQEYINLGKVVKDIATENPIKELEKYKESQRSEF